MNVYLPAVQKAITQLQADESPSNQAVLAPIITNMQAQVQLATTATNGLSAQLLAFTPAEWNADHGLLSGPATELRIADRALAHGVQRPRQADRYLRRHMVPPPRLDHDHFDHDSTTVVPPLLRHCGWATGPSARTGWAWPAPTASPARGDAPANALDGNLNDPLQHRQGPGPRACTSRSDLGSPQAFDELEMDVPNSANDYARGYSGRGRPATAAPGPRWPPARAPRRRRS